MAGPVVCILVSDGKITVKSDRPIPTAGGKRLLHDCEMLLDRSPLKANGRQYNIYVTTDNWRQRLFFQPIRMPTASPTKAFAGCS